MKPSKEQLYDAMGELIYALALSDGAVQDEEITALEQVLKAHPWAAAIQWSFDYENQKKKPLEEAYQKAMTTCKDYGPSEEYAFLLEVLQTIAEASEGMVTPEAELIIRFREELTEHFQKSL